ncbi:hypothetical protein PsorP6_007818 [Peronosclerospora sorghi]|uniref:Uncharacterized protein n=1 Tax=Peronosclerospora sorghi TaxID=230839 RepID=A0ACC0W967_9STRA|nr:hypothetical protein PsorP6_007818 [Peronosclerospora sorghi]
MPPKRKANLQVYSERLLRLNYKVPTTCSVLDVRKNQALSLSFSPFKAAKRFLIPATPIRER